jgi:hypothetical protein
MSTKIHPTNPPSFPNLGVTLAFLESIANSPEMRLPMVNLTRPDLTDQQLNDMDSSSLRSLAKELRVFSELNGNEEFAKYDDVSISDEAWRNSVRAPPTTTTHVNLCLVKPATKGTGLCYALSVVANGPRPEWVGVPTDFVSHAWRYKFVDLVVALRSEADERDCARARRGLAPIADVRFYWNDIFVENQNATDDKPEGYFFTAFRDAVESIGRTILILLPLRAAIPLSRAWCVWEIFCSIAGANVELEIALPPSERSELERMLREEFKEVVRILMDVRVENSEAFVESDRREIHRIVREQCEGGFEGVNGVICEGLRRWLSRTALEMVSGVVEGEEVEEELRLMNQVGRMLQEQGRLGEAEVVY